MKDNCNGSGTGMPATGDMKGAAKVANVGQGQTGSDVHTGNYNSDRPHGQIDSKPSGGRDYYKERDGK